MLTHFALPSQADHTPALDSSMLPTGLASATARTPLDFAQGSATDPASHRALGDNFPPNGVDHNLVFSTPLSTEPRVVLSSPDGKTSLAFRTNQSSVQCYTGGGMNGSGSRKAAHAVDGAKGYEKFDGVVCRVQLTALHVCNIADFPLVAVPRVPPPSRCVPSPRTRSQGRNRHDPQAGRGVRQHG